MVGFFLFKTKSLELCLVHRRKKVSSPPHLHSAFPVSQQHFSFLVTEGYSHFLSSSFCICHCSDELSPWLLWLFGDPRDCISSQTIQLPCLPHQPWFLLLQIHQPYIRNVGEVWGDGSVGNVLAVQTGKPKFKPRESIYKKSGACNPRAGTVETRKLAGHPVYLNLLALGSVKYSAWQKIR